MFEFQTCQFNVNLLHFINQFKNFFDQIIEKKRHMASIAMVIKKSWIALMMKQKNTNVSHASSLFLLNIP